MRSINFCADNDQRSVSQYMFRDIFYRKFNLKFKQPAQDTCNYCDSMKHKINATPLKSIDRMKLIQEKDSHLQTVEILTREYKEYVCESRLSADEKVVLIFDTKL